MIVGVQAIPACFDVEQQRFSCPPEALEVHPQTYDSLLRHPIRTDSEGYKTVDATAFEPALAQQCEPSRDGQTYTLQLRRGVRSAAGHELTAHDVKWAWERAFALNSWSARAARRCGISSPDALRVVQPYTAQLRLDAPSPRIRTMLAAPFPAIYDLETVRQHCPVGDPWGNGWLRSHAAGFGAYTLEDAVPGEEAILSANLNYWQGTAREKRVL
ncbi:MAG TPA: ABC transporter substrate-binding protein, partial [Chloroflexota bacterium]|nr:ABC transporter substrate-binding protein [Chloroflexota bacterium]